jgi:hypothetical protein
VSRKLQRLETNISEPLRADVVLTLSAFAYEVKVLLEAMEQATTTEAASVVE